MVPEGAENVSRPSPDYPMLPTIPLSAFSDPKKTKTSHVSKVGSRFKKAVTTVYSQCSDCIHYDLARCQWPQTGHLLDRNRKPIPLHVAYKPFNYITTGFLHETLYRVICVTRKSYIFYTNLF